MTRTLTLLILLAGAAAARAEDGYERWLRYHRVADAARLKQYQAAIGELLVEGRSPTTPAVSSELQRGLAGLLGSNVPVVTRVTRDGVVVAAGSDAVNQYAPAVRDRFASLDRVTDDYLLWFHRVPWDYRMSSGRSLWNEIRFRYCRGVRTPANTLEYYMSINLRFVPGN